MLRIGCLSLWLGVVSGWGLCCGAAEPLRPNVVFIMADDLGWGDVAFHGGPAPTPHLDQLAREGLELRQHYVAPVCSPTRCGLLTGRCWSRFAVTTPQNERCLPWDTATLPRILKDQGYATCLIGKWHLGSLPSWGPGRFGFDHAYGSLAGGVSPWNHRYKQGPYSHTWHRNGELLEEAGHVTDLLTDEAIAWLKARDETPFFLYLPYTAVHLPLKEPDAWLAEVPAAVQGDVPRHYAASVMHLDDAVGRIVATLDRLQLRERTLLVFTSDNGGSTAENNDLKYPDDNCPNGRLTGNNLPLRGQKGSVYEGGIRVPTIVSWPGVIPAGQRDEPVQIIDWMPTFCALAGFSAASDLKWDGSDLSGWLLSGEPLAERGLYTVGPQARERALRWADWKLVLRGRGAEQTQQLFNLARDPGESQDLADQHPQRVQALMRRLEQMAAGDGDAAVTDSTPTK